ncbi:phage major capsid protein [Streptomyces griseorubiginosus]|uniref:phage major capsid protein n=1 Tax=Streptomyces griseorubiginosus TaxID=67304 RepID=UPI002E804D63|nr:phage major capsid protein [Streptomyces griseorubiginosus]WUB45326.1 phage major capsid protein [Streptomyces griseorubiginosus]WUB53843.1 phage major capsid protein [Streptomyces griseorubiginosus]
MLAYLRKQMQSALEARAALKTEIDGIVKAAETAGREKLSADEQSAFDAKRAEIRAKDDEIEQLDARIKELEEDEQREQRAADIHARHGQAGERRERVTVTSEPETYRRGGQTSYFRDLFRAQMKGDTTSIERLSRNDREVADRLQRIARGAEEAIAGLEARALTTTDGAGGEFVPPLWMINDYIALARGGRVVADQVRPMALPPNTDSISLPRIASGTAVAEQTNQNTAVQNTDATTNSVTAAVTTIAGQQVVAQQLLDQSPINMDQILLADLAADYAVKADVFVINNNAANKVGLLNVSGLNAVTYTDATPTVAELYPKGADAVQQIHTGRFLPGDKHFMHPRRWAWMTAAVDTAGRPLVVPAANMPQNALASFDAVNSEGFVGTWHGLPVYVDPNIPTNLGAGTNEDRIITLRSTDVIFFEGTPQAEAFRETKADQLSVLLRFFNYAALHASRYPKAISVISGTGLITPTF